MTNQLQLPRKKEAQIISNVSWEQFEEIDHSFADIAGIKFAYLDGTLEIMTISPEHEDAKATIGVLLEAYMRAKNIRFYRRGGPTLGRREQGARNEPDESYNLGTRKPYPDLAIEVVITSGGINKLEGYKRMGVPEVWVWEDGTLKIHLLRDDYYEKANYSELLLDLPIDIFCRYMTYHDQYDAVTEFTSAIAQKN